MELRFIPPDLTFLDENDSEVLGCSVWSDVRPSHGLAGLCDWRLAGRISALQQSGFITGALGEVVMIPGKPKLRFDKLLFFGAGPRASFDEETFNKVIAQMLKTTEGLSARAGVMELPGRDGNLIPAERAADLLLASAGRKREHDIWVLVENAEARERITEHMIEERRRIRRVL